MVEKIIVEILKALGIMPQPVYAKVKSSSKMFKR